MSRALSAGEVTPSAELIAAYARYRCRDLLYFPGFVADPARVQRALTNVIAWRHETIELFGRRHRVPRLVAWYGDDGVAYRYSGVLHRAGGWPDELVALRDELAARLGIPFNFVLANLYRDGRDALGWHSDDEPELGARPCIASLSFGATRRFRLRARGDLAALTEELSLEAGSLMLMWGDSQRDWQHCVPRTREAVGARLNLTFRRVK